MEVRLTEGEEDMRLTKDLGGELVEQSQGKDEGGWVDVRRDATEGFKRKACQVHLVRWASFLGVVVWLVTQTSLHFFFWKPRFWTFTTIR